MCKDLNGLGRHLNKCKEKQAKAKVGATDTNEVGDNTDDEAATTNATPDSINSNTKEVNLSSTDIIPTGKVSVGNCSVE